MIRSFATGLALTAALLAMTACASNDDEVAGSSDSPLPVATDAEPVPSQLANLTAPQVTSLLGPADFRRQDGPALLLQYRSSQCVLDVILYRDAASGDDFRVSYIESRGANAARVKNAACLSSINASRRQGRG